MKALTTAKDVNVNPSKVEKIVAINGRKSLGIVARNLLSAKIRIVERNKENRESQI